MFTFSRFARTGRHSATQPSAEVPSVPSRVPPGAHFQRVPCLDLPFPVCKVPEQSNVHSCRPEHGGALYTEHGKYSSALDSKYTTSQSFSRQRSDPHQDRFLSMS